MPSQDEIMKEILELVGRGAGRALTPEEGSSLRERYYGWIVKKKDGAPNTPQDAWESEAGEKIKKQIEKIGKELTEKKKTKSVQEDVVAAAVKIESLSNCPHCPDPMGG